MLIKLALLDPEGNREVLNMSDIKVWLEGKKVEITSVIPVENEIIVAASFSRCWQNNEFNTTSKWR